MSESTPEASKVELDYEPTLALPELLENFRRQQPQKPALIEGAVTRSYAEMVERIYQMANGLIALGVEPGDRVAMLSRNSMAYSELFAATLVAGACAVPLQSMITDESLKLMLKDSGARVLVVSSDYAGMAATFLAEQDQLLPGGLMGFDFSEGDFTGFEQWLSGQANSAPGVQLDPDGEFNIIYSSGTTGVPKGIVHSHRTRQGLAKGLMALGINGDSITLISTPLYSNTTITTWWPSLCAGATQVIMSKFDAEQALADIAKYKVTHAMFVPVQYDRIMRLDSFGDHALDSMQVKYCTSAPLRAALKADIIDRFPGELIEFYGLTEGGVGTLFIGSIAREHDKLGSVGQALPGASLKIIDDKGVELGAKQTGEIVGRSGNMSNGYHNREQANLDMYWYDTDGSLYYKSGDVGYLDDDGWLYLSDRKKDMIISGGFNIYATDLELVLLEHPQVHEAAIIALASSEWGETPLAIVVTEDAATASEEDLRSWANERLGKSQRISQLVYIDDLPKSSIGKVLKKELRQSYAALAK
jgi:long-chain acyl-CoA synthetase